MAQAGNRADGDGVVAAEHERNARRGQRKADLLGCLAADRGNFPEVAISAVAETLGFGDGDGEISGVFDAEVKQAETLLQFGGADGGGAHIDAAAGLAEVEGNADDADGTAGYHT